jgi:hypothetical protein
MISFRMIAHEFQGRGGHHLLAGQQHGGNQLRDDVIAARREAAYRLIEAVEVVDLTHPVLTRAAQPLPTVLGTLDAIHLATALMWREQMGQDLVMATHDVALGTAARASGLRVIGV